MNFAMNPANSKSGLVKGSSLHYNESPSLWDGRTGPFFYAENSRHSDSDSSDSGRSSRRAASSSSPESLVDPRLNKQVRVIQVGGKRISTSGSDDGKESNLGKMLKLSPDDPASNNNNNNNGQEEAKKPKLNPFFTVNGLRRLSSTEVGNGLTVPHRPISGVPGLKNEGENNGSTKVVAAPAVKKRSTGSFNESGMTWDWYKSPPLNEVELSTIVNWKVIGDKSIADEEILCEKKVYDRLLKFRKDYLKLHPEVAQSARGRSNPFEDIPKSIFMNRAAIKLANIDADLDFTLTDPRNPDGSHFVGSNNIFYFADICAGPGGFSEYILYRKRFNCKGVGITLRNSGTDLDINNVRAGPPECYELYYGKNGDGNIYDPINVKSFVQIVLRTTETAGVHLVLADGGFDVGGKELVQEQLFKQMYVSQFLIALQVLRENGTFVCKLFDTYTPFSVGLLYVIHLCFDKITIYKPRMSRGQNTEKYLICKGKRSKPLVDSFCKHLAECHLMLWEYSRKTSVSSHAFDLLGVVPRRYWSPKNRPDAVSNFINKMTGWNTNLAEVQTVGIELALRYADNLTLNDPSKEATARKFYSLWKLPLLEDGTFASRQSLAVRNEQPEDTCERLWNEEIEMGCLEERVLKASEYEGIFQSPYDWRVVVVQGSASSFRETRGFYLGQGGTNVFKYNIKKDEWDDAPLKFELPKDTLLYGEVVNEFITWKKSSKAFHIIDAYVIDGTNLSKLHYIARHEICSKLVKSLNKLSRPDLPIIRVKQLVRMENMADLLDKCERRKVPCENPKVEYWTCPIDHTDETVPCIVAAGMMFLKLTKDPWRMFVSKKIKRKYWYNPQTAESTFEMPPPSISTFMNTMQTRTIWKWSDITNLEVPEDFETKGAECIDFPPEDPEYHETVHAAHLLKHIAQFRPSAQ